MSSLTYQDYLNKKCQRENLQQFVGGGLVELKNLRIPGVLQRLALTYFVVATLQVFFAGRGQTLLPIEVTNQTFYISTDIFMNFI